MRPADWCFSGIIYLYIPTLLLLFEVTTNVLND